MHHARLGMRTGHGHEHGTRLSYLSFSQKGKAAPSPSLSSPLRKREGAAFPFFPVSQKEKLRSSPSSPIPKRGRCGLILLPLFAKGEGAALPFFLFSQKGNGEMPFSPSSPCRKRENPPSPCSHFLKRRMPHLPFVPLFAKEDVAPSRFPFFPYSLKERCGLLLLPIFAHGAMPLSRKRGNGEDAAFSFFL